MIHFSSRRASSVAFSTCLPRHPGEGKSPVAIGRVSHVMAVVLPWVWESILMLPMNYLIDMLPYSAKDSSPLAIKKLTETGWKPFPKSWRSLYEYGERRHCNAELAKEWIFNGLPRYNIQYKYVLFKPLSLTDSDENIRAVIFPVNPVELSGLVTLAGSVMPGTDPVQVPQGADCNSITAFAYAQVESAAPRAVLGMLGVDGRELMRKRFRDDILTLTLPKPLFQRMEEEANDCVFQIPSWKRLVGR